MDNVWIHPQPKKFVRSLAPQLRGRLLRAMKALPTGDHKALEGRLSGYWRLREGGYRIIYKDEVIEGVRTFDGLFLERRPIVYQLFEQLLVEQALE
jgi:mRNA-degrading endonuclease RelE of RelBE toxin-antitoxin system